MSTFSNSTVSENSVPQRHILVTSLAFPPIFPKYYTSKMEVLLTLPLMTTLGFIYAFVGKGKNRWPWCVSHISCRQAGHMKVGYEIFVKSTIESYIPMVFYSPITGQKLSLFWVSSPFFTHMLILNFKRKRLLKKNKCLCNLGVPSNLTSTQYVSTHICPAPRVGMAVGGDGWKGVRLVVVNKPELESPGIQLLGIYTWVTM